MTDALEPERVVHPKIIVADDSLEQRRLLRGMLEELGFLPVEAADGRELFWELERSRRSGTLDSVIVIADVHMPVYDGLEVLEAWSDDDAGPHAFVVMTGFPNADVARRAHDLGAILLPKPFTLRDFTNLVRRLVA